MANTATIERKAPQAPAKGQIPQRATADDLHWESIARRAGQAI